MITSPTSLYLRVSYAPTESIEALFEQDVHQADWK